MLQAVLSCQAKPLHLFLSAVLSVRQSACVYGEASIVWWMLWLLFVGNFLSDMRRLRLTLRRLSSRYDITCHPHMLFCCVFSLLEAPQYKFMFKQQHMTCSPGLTFICHLDTESCTMYSSVDPANVFVPSLQFLVSHFDFWKYCRSQIKRKIMAV